MRLLGPMVVPWDDDGDLARAYHEELLIHRGHYEWLGFMDCDVEPMNRDYAALVRGAIGEHPQAGLITCRVNRQHRANRCQSLQIDADLNSRERLHVADKLREKFGRRSREIGAGEEELISGCWFYVHVERAIEVGAFVHPKPAFWGVDHVAHERLHEAGHPAVVLDGLFVWHRYYHLEARVKRDRLGKVVPEVSKRRGR